MKADYLDSHERHQIDAKLLLDNERWANARHLYGLASECGLKRMMQEFNMKVNENNGTPKLKEDRVHANEIWKRYESYRNGHVLGVNYILPEENPFLNWNISDRYACRESFDKHLAVLHKQGCDLVQNIIKRARNDGLLK